MSWPYRAGFLGNEAPVEIPETNEERHALIQKIGANWADPFGTFVRNISSDEVLKDLIPQDYPPPLDLRSRTKAVLMGDAVHAMAMCEFASIFPSTVDIEADMHSPGRGR